MARETEEIVRANSVQNNIEYIRFVSNKQLRMHYRVPLQLEKLNIQSGESIDRVNNQLLLSCYSFQLMFSPVEATPTQL